MSSVDPGPPIRGIVQSSLRNFAQRLSLQRKTQNLRSMRFQARIFADCQIYCGGFIGIEPRVKCCCAIPTEGGGGRRDGREAREGEDAGQMKHA